jgi:hypothetical protein
VTDPAQGLWRFCAGITTELVNVREGVIVYICAIVIARVRFGIERASFVILHGSVLIRGLIVCTCKSE